MVRKFGVGAAGLAVVAVAVFGAASTASAAPERPDRPERAPLLRTGAPGAIHGHYIVVLEARASGAARTAAAGLARANGGEVTHEYAAALNGFAATLPDRAVEALRKNPNVAYIEADHEVSLAGTQSNPTWGLDRIDQRNRPVNRTYVYDGSGSGVTAYIIDTGIRRSHQQFDGRVLNGFTSIADGRGTNDCNGHGTHVAGTVGSQRYGVAKGVTLRPVRVLNCGGSASNAKVIAGVDWVTGHHTGTAPAVANMSLGGSPSTALDAAVRTSILDGVTYVAAAGNEGVDACGSSPASVGSALTVGATTPTDARASFSNFGRCLDIFAPGSNITSTWYTGDRATASLSGTSMAAPHVTGAAALYLAAYPSASPAQVGAAVIAASTLDHVSGAKPSSPNRLLYSRVNQAVGAPEPPPAGNLLTNPGFEAGPVGWSASPGVVTDDPFAPARTGSWKAWLNGYGDGSTDELAQTVAVPVGGGTLTYHLWIDTEESPGDVYDELTVEVVSGGTPTTLATYSNLDEGSSYEAHAFDLGAFAGSTVTLRFTGVEDSTLATSFLVDDVTLTTG